MKLPEKCIGFAHEASGSINADWSEPSAPPEQRRVIEWIYDAVDGVTLAEKAVLRKVLWLDKTEGLGCNAKPKSIGAMVCLSARSVRRCLESLIEKGLIRHAEYGEGYEVVWPFDSFPPTTNELTSNAPYVVKQWVPLLSDYIRRQQRPALTLHSGTDG